MDKFYSGKNALSELHEVVYILADLYALIFDLHCITKDAEELEKSRKIADLRNQDGVKKEKILYYYYYYIIKINNK